MKTKRLIAFFTLFAIMLSATILPLSDAASAYEDDDGLIAMVYYC